LRVAVVARVLISAGWLLVGAVMAHAQTGGERYFIDFRARNATYIGHTYIVYFRVDAKGRVVEQHHTGLVPEENVWNGIVSPIRATIRKYKDDARLPTTMIYRRELSAAEYARVVRAVHFLQAHEHQWHLVFYNCNDFAIEVAEVLEMRRPPSLLPPSVWVGMLRILNGG